MFRCVNAEVNASSYSTLGTPDLPSCQIRELGAGTYGERELLKMLRKALMIATNAALTLLAIIRAFRSISEVLVPRKSLLPAHDWQLLSGVPSVE